MDLSFEEENNFVLPDPSGKLDFTEDENENNGLKTIVENKEQNIVPINNISNKEKEENFTDDESEDDSEDISEDRSEDGSEDGSENEKVIEKFTEPEYNKPIINQNLLLNKNLVKNKFNKGLQEPVTPALIKRKQFKPWFNSPTDSCLSPCTQKLFKSKKQI